MNRPLWLDTLRVAVLLSPPLILAAVAASLVSRHFAWPFWVWACLYLAAAIVLEAAWLAGSVALSHRRAPDDAVLPGDAAEAATRARYHDAERSGKWPGC